MGERGVSFLVFSDDWGEHPSSCQHIFRHLVKEYPVVWVNTVGMRLPRLDKQDLSKGVRKLKRMFSTAWASKAQVKLPKNLSVLQPLMVPYNKGVFRRFNRLSVVRAVKKELKRRKIGDPILVATVPNACDYIGFFNERRVVYYCVDDFSQWPGHEKEYILKMERDLISKSDVFIATSQKLFNRLKAYNKAVHLLLHGLDLTNFEKPPQENRFFKDMLGPKVGYVGLVDQRLDWELLNRVAHREPKLNFIFVGRREVNHPIFEAKNVKTFPPVSYEDVPSILKSLDVLILPYVVNEFTETINPLKLKEYLASGKPIVASPLPEIAKWKDYIFLAQNEEEWIRALKQALTQKGNGLPIEKLKQEDWSHKAQEFLNFCLG